ncbi:hypothetical protein [Salibacterium lacus]|uniref:Uncharacterized protein n=1 Tax=Salibacterium lacus TaxID=1898109 RepID=A0ABW5SXK4_9BACI
MKISDELLDYVADADMHTKMKNVPYSTDLRSVVTVDYLLERHIKKAPAEGTAST